MLNKKLGIFVLAIARMVVLYRDVYKPTITELGKNKLFTIPKLVNFPFHTNKVDSIPNTLFYYIKQEEALTVYMKAMKELYETLDKSFHEGLERPIRETIHQAILTMNNSIRTKLPNIQPTVDFERHDKSYIRSIKELLEEKKQITEITLGGLDSFFNLRKWEIEAKEKHGTPEITVDFRKDIDSEINLLLEKTPMIKNENVVVQGVFKTLDCINLKCVIDQKATPRRPRGQYQVVKDETPTTQNPSKEKSSRFAIQAPKPRSRSVSRESVIVHPIEDRRSATPDRATARKPPPKKRSATIERGSEREQNPTQPKQKAVPPLPRRLVSGSTTLNSIPATTFGLRRLAGENMGNMGRAFSLSRARRTSKNSVI